MHVYRGRGLSTGLVDPGFVVYAQGCLHGEVGDESSFGDLDVKGDALGIGPRIDHGAFDRGVGEARRNSALHLVAFNCDVITLAGLWAQTQHERLTSDVITQGPKL